MKTLQRNQICKKNYFKTLEKIFLLLKKISKIQTEVRNKNRENNFQRNSLEMNAD